MLFSGDDKDQIKVCNSHLAATQLLKPLLYIDFLSQLQHQKLINSWSVEQREEVTCPAVHNPIDANFLVAVNKTVNRK